ncbi:MAG: xanthine dehydrogenase accessory protein XdhC [Pseudomonadota bacterium]
MSPETLLDSPVGLVLAEITAAEGSAPRERGAWMLVGAEAIAGTIGGGRLEWEVMARARAMLEAGPAREELVLALGPAIGQCCGGRVHVSLQRLEAPGRSACRARLLGEAAARPAAYVFGAGHTGMALARALAPLPLSVMLVDARPDLLAEAPEGVEPQCAAIPEAVVRAAPAGSAFAIMTHDHALDFLLTHEALDRGDAAYVGLIGSATKRARFIRHRGQSCAALTCPIGAAGLGDKRPAVIALHTAAEIMGALAARFEAQAAETEGLAWIR